MSDYIFTDWKRHCDVEKYTKYRFSLKKKVVLNVFIFKMGEYFIDPTINQGKQVNAYEQM